MASQVEMSRKDMTELYQPACGKRGLSVPHVRERMMQGLMDSDSSGGQGDCPPRMAGKDDSREATHMDVELSSVAVTSQGTAVRIQHPSPEASLSIWACSTEKP